VEVTDIGRIYRHAVNRGKRGLRTMPASIPPSIRDHFPSIRPHFSSCFPSIRPLSLFPLRKPRKKNQYLNAELCRKSLELVGNPNVLVNIISRRVRQLNAGGGGANRPLLENPGTLGVADIALTELVEGKLGWEMLDDVATPAKPGRG